MRAGRWWWWRRASALCARWQAVAGPGVVRDLRGEHVGAVARATQRAWRGFETTSQHETGRVAGQVAGEHGEGWASLLITTWNKRRFVFVHPRPSPAGQFQVGAGEDRETGAHGAQP